MPDRSDRDRAAASWTPRASGTSALAAATTMVADPVSGWILVAIAATTLFARQVLMPAINAATDARANARFKALHALSVLITLAHIGGAAIVILRLSGGS